MLAGGVGSDVGPRECREGAIWEERVGHVERGWHSARESGVDIGWVTVQA